MTATTSGTADTGGGQMDALSVLITGAAGFIGSHLCDRLLDEGHEVWGLDNFDTFYSPASKRRNLELALDYSTMHLVEGELRDEILLDGLMSDVTFDAVVHLAARPGVKESLENSDLCYESNVRGTLRLLEALQRHRVSTLVFASSSSVYGERSPLPFSEEDPADRPASPLGAAKRAGEMLCHVHHRLYGLTAYAFRLFNVYGPRQRPDLTVHRFARCLLTDRPVRIHGDEASRQDHVFVHDVVDGIVRALKHGRRREENAYELFNLGTGEAIRTDELVAVLADVLGVDAELEHVDPQPGELPVTQASIDRARRVLGWEPETPLEAGLRSFAEWLGQQIEQVDASALPPRPGRQVR